MARSAGFGVALIPLIAGVGRVSAASLPDPVEMPDGQIYSEEMQQVHTDAGVDNESKDSTQEKQPQNYGDNTEVGVPDDSHDN